MSPSATRAAGDGRAASCTPAMARSARSKRSMKRSAPSESMAQAQGKNGRIGAEVAVRHAGAVGEEIVAGEPLVLDLREVEVKVGAFREIELVAEAVEPRA